ncbi:MAG: sulfatase family protein [Longimicrobiales bacterium]
MALGSARTRSPILLIAAWFGLICGFVEAAVLLIQRYALHEIVWASVHVAWMSPLSYVLFFGLVGLALWLASLYRDRFADPALVVGIFALCAYGSLLSLVVGDRWHAAALAALSLGLAVQTGWLAASHWAGFRRMVRVTAGPMAAAVGFLMVGIIGTRLTAEQISSADVPQARAESPNVLLLILDTVRAANLSLYGYERLTTPRLERIAQRAVVFDRAIVTSPWTLPSHASIFTGRHPRELEFGFQRPLGERYATLAELLRDSGYQTAAFTANYYYTTRESGLGRGFIHFSSSPINLWQLLLSSTPGQLLHLTRYFEDIEERTSSRKSAAEVNAEFLAWLDTSERPFFAFLNYFDAHRPYSAPEAFDTLWQSAEQREADFTERWFGSFGAQPRSGREAVRRYDAAIAYMDHEIGRLLDELDSRNILDNTILIITSDHGELFGEHGRTGHATSLYMPALHVPLLISFPGSSAIPAGQRIPAPATLRDLPATVLELVGHRAAAVPGRPLTRLWANARATADTAVAVSELGRNASIVMKDWHYIHYRNGREELYDLRRDPREMVDLSRSRSAEPILKGMRQRLKEAERAHPARSGTATVPPVQWASRSRRAPN